jgi:hypothetical protein
MNRFPAPSGDYRLAGVALGHIQDAIVAADPQNVNRPGAYYYVGAEYVAVVVPNGLKAILKTPRWPEEFRYVSHTAVLHAIGRRGACLQLRERKTILRARILYPFRRGAQRVNVLLIPRSELWLEDAATFDGAIQVFDPDFDCELSIGGFNSPRSIRGAGA